MLTVLRGTTILVVEQQSLVAADIEDRLLDAGVGKVAVLSKPNQEFDAAAYDGLIINASQDRKMAQRIARAGAAAKRAIVVMHDDPNRARDLFPSAQMVEIPFDSRTIVHALCEALATPKV